VQSHIQSTIKHDYQTQTNGKQNGCFWVEKTTNSQFKCQCQCKHQNNSTIENEIEKERLPLSQASEATLGDPRFLPRRRLYDNKLELFGKLA
jgi:hypothetical protein